MRAGGQKALLALALFAGVSLRAGNAGADEGKQREREQIIKEINELLRDMKDRLDRVPGASSTSEIDEARSKAEEAKRRAEKMREVKESDSTAGTMADYYPGHIDKFRESASYVRQMKLATLQQSDARLWEKCQESDRRLREQVDRYLEKNDPRGMTEMPRLAEEAQRNVEGALRTADDTHRQMESWKGYARNFSESHGGWSDVTTELRDAADGLWDQWRQRHEDAHRKCDDLARGKGHPYVAKGLEKLVDSDKARGALYQRMDQLLEQVAGLLSDIPSRSGTSELDSALSLADQLLSALDTLKSARGEDDKARRISDAWPDKVKELRRAIEALKLGKAQQNVIDRAQEVCKNAEGELQALTQKRLADPDDAEAGVKAISERAERLGSEFRGRLEAADRKREELDRHASEAMRFDFTEGKWGPVRERVHAAARGILGYFGERLATAKSECGRLAMGVQHPLVVDTLKKLGDTRSSAQRTYDRVKAEYEQWKSDRKDLRPGGRFRQENVDKIRLAICDGDEEQLEDRAKNAADRAAAAIQERKSALLARLQKLIDEFKAAETNKDSVVGDLARKLLRNMRDSFKRLDGAAVNTVLRGANNPKLNSRIQLGLRKHKEMQADSGRCTYAEVKVPGGSIDCVKVSSGRCEVIEIKPNNEAARAKGRQQLERYKASLEEMHRGGNLPEQVKPCIVGGKLSIAEYDVEVYEFCPVPIEEIDTPTEPEDD